MNDAIFRSAGRLPHVNCILQVSYRHRAAVVGKRGRQPIPGSDRPSLLPPAGCGPPQRINARRKLFAEKKPLRNYRLGKRPDHQKRSCPQAAAARHPKYPTRGDFDESAVQNIRSSPENLRNLPRERRKSSRKASNLAMPLIIEKCDRSLSRPRASQGWRDPEHDGSDRSGGQRRGRLGDAQVHRRIRWRWYADFRRSAQCGFPSCRPRAPLQRGRNR